MAEVGFQQLLQEQKMTNELLRKQGEPANPVDSFKNSIAEIINDRLIDRKDKDFQRKEGIVKVDDEVQTSNTILDNQSKQFKTQIGFFEKQDTLLLKTSAGIAGMIAAMREMIARLARLNEFTEKGLEKDDLSTKLFKKHHNEDLQQNRISIALQRGLAGSFPGSPSMKEEEDKKTRRSENKRNKIFEQIGKGLGFVGEEIGKLKLFDSMGAGLKTLLKRIGLFALLFAGLKVLSSDEMLTFARFLDREFLPALSKLYNDFLKPAATFIFDLITGFAVEAADPDNSTLKRIANASGLLAAAVILFYSKNVAKLGFTLAMLPTKKIGKAIGNFLMRGLRFFGTMFFKGLGTLFAGAEGVAAGVKDFKNRGDVQEASEEAMETFISTFIGFFPDLAIQLAGLVTGIFFPELGKEIRAISVTKFIKKGLDDMEMFFDGVQESIRLYFVGLNDKFNPLSQVRDEEFEIEQNQRLTDTKKRLKDAEEFMKAGGAVDAKTLFDLKEEIKEAQFQLKRIKQFKEGRFEEFKPMYSGGPVKKGGLFLIGEGPGGRGGELVYANQNAMVLNQSRTDQMLNAALERGLSGGGGGGGVTVVAPDNSMVQNSSTTVVTGRAISTPNSLLSSIANST